MSDLTVLNDPPKNGAPSQEIRRSTRIRFALILTVLGFIIFIIGTKPEWFKLDRSPVVGFVQIAVFLIGLAMISIGGYLGLSGLWGANEKSIVADVGLRLVATGYVVVVFSGMADVFGMGSQPYPAVPFFGPIQAIGVTIGEMVIGIGFLMLIPYHRHSS
jgi:hypothetical protein